MALGLARGGGGMVTGQIDTCISLYRFNCLYIKSIGADIESIVLMFNQMTTVRCDKVMISIQLSMYQINWIDIESNSNKATLYGAL